MKDFGISHVPGASSVTAPSHPEVVHTVPPFGTTYCWSSAANSVRSRAFATQCAALTELSPSATAYHLKLLERYGFAEPAPPRADRRERPWRATGRRTTVDLESSTPAGASAAAAVAAAYIDTTRVLALEFTAAEYAEPEEWRKAALSNADLWLTVEEVKRVSHELEAVLKPLRGRSIRGQRPAGSKRVRVMNVVVPHPRTHPQSVPPRP